MKVALIILFVWLVAAPCYAQAGSQDKHDAPDDVYLKELTRLVTGLQKKNPWTGWKYGTEMTVTHLNDSEAAGATESGYPRWEQVYKLLEKDKLWTITSIDGGVASLSEFSIEGQTGFIFTPLATKEVVPAYLDMDGHKIACKVFQSSITNWFWQHATFTVMKNWVLASNPSVLLRTEHQSESSNGYKDTYGWTMTSAQVTKKIGDRDFPCVEIKDQMRVFPDMNVITTKYLNPDVPGHLVEMIVEYYKIGKPEEKPVLYMITHQRVMALKLP